MVGYYDGQYKRMHSRAWPSTRRCFAMTVAWYLPVAAIPLEGWRFSYLDTEEGWQSISASSLPHAGIWHDTLQHVLMRTDAFVVQYFL